MANNQELHNIIMRRRQKIIIWLLAAILILGVGVIGYYFWEKYEREQWVLYSLQKNKQMTTLESIMELGQAVEQYIMDHVRIGSPKVNGIYMLSIILKLDKMSLRVLRDEWGNSIIYESNQVVGQRHYSITSTGADGMPGPIPMVKGVVKRFEEDIIWVSGRFVQKPLSSFD